MSSRLPLLVACVSRFRQARVAAALEGAWELMFVDSFDELAAHVAQRGPLVVVADLRDSRGTAIESMLHQIERPGRAMVLCISRSELTTAVLMKATGDVIIADVNDAPAMLKEHVIRAAYRVAADRAAAALRERLSDAVLTMAETVIRNPSCTTVEALAERVGVHRQTLSIWCRNHGTLHPEELLIWSRLLLVGALLEYTSYSVPTLAASLNFPSTIALRNQLKRYTGQTCLEIRARGFDTMLQQFDSDAGLARITGGVELAGVG